MAERKCMTPWGDLTQAQVATLAEQAFQLCSYRAINGIPAGEWESPEEFCEGLVSAFESLLAQRVQKDGHRYLRDGYGEWAEQLLAEVPRGFRPSYEAGRLFKLVVKAEAKAATPAREAVASSCQLAAVAAAWAGAAT